MRVGEGSFLGEGRGKGRRTAAGQGGGHVTYDCLWVIDVVVDRLQESR